MNELQINQTQYLQNLTADIYSKYIAYLDCAEKTIETYKRAIRQFYFYCNENNVLQPQRSDVLNWRNYLLENKSANTTQSYMIAIRLFFAWTEQEKIYPNIAEHIKGARISKEHKKDNLTSEQVKSLINGIDTSTINGKRDKAIIMTMIVGGLRTIEIQRANIEDLRTLGDKLVLYIQGKGRNDKAEYIKITQPIFTAIQDYINSLPTAPKQTDPLFSSLNHATNGKRLTTKSISRIVKTRLINVGLNSTRLTAHSLRHTTATLNLLNGGTLEETQQLLRHSNINTTMIYAHALDRLNNKSEERITNVLFG